MPRRGKRRRLARNVFADSSGISGIVTLRGHTDELRFPTGTPLPEIRRALEAHRRTLAVEYPETARGTVADAITRAVAQLGDSRADQDRRIRLAAWTAACGPERFVGLTRARLTEIVADWTRAGKSPSTIAKRISTLRELWRSIAPDDAPPHAIERIKRPRTPKSGIIRARPMALVRAVLANIEDVNQSKGTPSKARARLQLLAWTGQPPALLQQLKREHVRWHTSPPEIYLQPRRKGAGVDAGWIALLPAAVPALRQFFRLKADGPWDRGTLRRAWNVALKRTQRQLRAAKRDDEANLLTGMRPYDLRHSLAAAMLAAGGDVYAVSEYLRHSDIRTTLGYTTAASSTRTRAAVEALARVLADSPEIVSIPVRETPRRKRTTRE